jgi:hypothetical protein
MYPVNACLATQTADKFTPQLCPQGRMIDKIELLETVSRLSRAVSECETLLSRATLLLEQMPEEQDMVYHVFYRKHTTVLLLALFVVCFLCV